MYYVTHNVLPGLFLYAGDLGHVERLVPPVWERCGDAGALHLVLCAFRQQSEEVLQLVTPLHRHGFGDAVKRE